MVTDDRFPKICACGGVYPREAWERLKLVGYDEPDDPKDDVLEHRICTRCGSTIAIALTAEEAMGIF